MDDVISPQVSPRPVSVGYYADNDGGMWVTYYTDKEKPNGCIDHADILEAYGSAAEARAAAQGGNGQ